MTKNKIQRNITRPIVMLSTIFIPVLMFVFIIVQGMAPHVAAAQSTEIETIATNDWQPSTDATVDKLSNSLVNINATQAVTTYTLYLPIIFKPLESPTLLSVSVPTSLGSLSSSQATASWTAVTNAVSYELEESQSADFSDSTIYDVGTVTSYDISHTSTWNNRFYYRVRAVGIVNSGWSNVLDQTYILYDSFNDPTTGWAMRREDLDDVDNSTSYANGIFKMKIHGRWDSMIAGPLTPVPETWPGYAIDTRVILEDGIDNLHSYGIIFGGDWNGVSQCPNSTMTSCYNHFYRINVIWFGGPDKLRVSLKRIDYHNYATDKDVGQTLMGHRDITVHDPDGWNDWSIQVRSNGVILVYLNGNLITSVNDTKYIGGGTYFGGFASSDEYLGTAAWYAYYRVRPLP